MPEYTVTFYPQGKTVKVKKGQSLLEAATRADIRINSVCGGDGICGRCKMIVKSGAVSGEVTNKLTREEIKNGVVLACMSFVESDLKVEIPEETLACETVTVDKDAEPFSCLASVLPERTDESPPLVRKVYLELDPPTLMNNTADHERLCEAICRKLHVCSMQTGLKITRMLPQLLRTHDFRVTATVGLRKGVAEVMNIEGGNREANNYLAVVDLGTTTIVAHLVGAATRKTLAAHACFNSQATYGREVTRRMIAAETDQREDLRRRLTDDVNQLIANLARDAGIALRDITAVVCAGNPAMMHFLLSLPTENIRRYPYVPAAVDLPPLRAAEVGLQINPRGLLYSLPGISGWVGSDITAGILATGIHKSKEISALMDIGTNGEIVIGNREWLVASSASAGPALEGGSMACGMRAEPGAIESVFAENGEIGYKVIGDDAPRGICGSGILDLICVLLAKGVINRSGKFIEGSSPRLATDDGTKRFVLSDAKAGRNGRAVFITEPEIENVITAKAAIFAALRILLRRLDLSPSDVKRLCIAGAFGNHIDIQNARCMGLIPRISTDRVEFVGNTSILGAKIAALHQEAFDELDGIRAKTTCYDLMGADDYVEEFQKAMFLPHTDIEQFEASGAFT